MIALDSDDESIKSKEEVVAAQPLLKSSASLRYSDTEYNDVKPARPKLIEVGKMDFLGSFLNFIAKSSSHDFTLKQMDEFRESALKVNTFFC